MKQIKFFSLMLLLALVSFSSCKKDDDKTEQTPVSSSVKTGEVTLSSPELYKDDWVYFSFETGAEVQGIDSTNFDSLLTWDIAFHSRLGRTNGGNSGIGIAAVYDTGIDNFDAVVSVDTTKFVSDTTVNLISMIGNYGPIYKIVPGNTVFNSAFAVDYTQHPPLYTCINRVYVLKTAKGKYAKIQIIGYFNEFGESRHINFKYAYQTNISLSLK